MMDNTSPTVLPAEHRKISATLTRARRHARALPGFPGDVPQSLAEAYAIQSQSLAGWADDVAGWKVGGVPPDYRDRFDDEWLAGPIFRSNTRFAHGDDPADMPVFAGGFAAIEAEFVLRTGATEAEDRLYIGTEIASSPVPDINGYGPCAVISDFGNNRGLLVGDEVADWRDLENIEVTTLIDGQEVGRAVVERVSEGVGISARFLRANLASRGIALPEGSFISCGALTGVHEADIGAQGDISFAGLGRLRMTLVEAEIAAETN